MPNRRNKPVDDPVVPEGAVEAKEAEAAETVPEEPVAEKASSGLTYVVNAFRIAYDHPKDGKQYAWSEGQELIDDGIKIPSSEVRRLHREGVLTLKEE